MMLWRKSGMRTWMLAGLVVAAAFPAAAVAESKYAIVPTTTIFPGDEITQSSVSTVEVTNPNLAPGYASTMKEVVGKVTKRTLVAGRTIPLAGLQEPYAVRRGVNVRLTFSSAHMVIAARGAPMQDAMTGDLIKVRNLDTGVTVSGTVMADGSVEVVGR